MTCEAVQALLSAYIDGELLSHEKDHLERHLSDCSLCLRECHSLSQTKRVLRAMPDHDLPEEFIAELTDMAEGGFVYYSESMAGSFFARFWKPALTAGLAFATILFAGLWFFDSPEDKPQAPIYSGVDRETKNSINRVKEKVDFQPVMPGSLPKGYRFESALVFKVKDDERIVHFRFTDGVKRFYLSEGRSQLMPVDAQIITLKNGRKGHLVVDSDTSILSWESDDLNFTLMGEVPHQTLINTADSFSVNYSDY